jgi:hypothetical protein
MAIYLQAEKEGCDLTGCDIPSEINAYANAKPLTILHFQMPRQFILTSSKSGCTLAKIALFGGLY